MIGTIRFDMDIIVPVHVKVEEAQLAVVRDGAVQVKMTKHNIADYDLIRLSLVSDIENEIASEIENRIASVLNGEDYSMDLLSVSLFNRNMNPPIWEYDPQGTSTFFDDLVDAIPIATGLALNEDKSKLILDLQLLPTWQNSATDADIERDPNSPDMEMGLSYGWGVTDYRYINPETQNDPNWDTTPSMWQQDIQTYHQIMASNNLKYLRIDPNWQDVVPYMPTLPIDWDTDPDVMAGYVDQVTLLIDGNISDNISVGWNYMDNVVSDLILKGITPILVLDAHGNHNNPRYAETTGLRIVAGDCIDIEGDPRSQYRISTTKAEFLFFFEAFHRALVRRYADQINYYVVGQELNAARWDVGIQLYRRGSHWADNQFQFDIFKTGHDLVEYDIIGVNFYPNDLAAEPSGGGYVGELVYATRRALLGLNKPSTPVWILETLYGIPSKSRLR